MSRWLVEELGDDPHGEQQRPRRPGDCAGDQLIARDLVEVPVIVVDRDGGGERDESVGDVEEHDEKVVRERSERERPKAQ